MQEIFTEILLPQHVLIFIFAYALGSIPVGLFVGLFFKQQDIRKHGSGNIGAANVARNFGFGLGVLVLVLDVFKGYVPVLVAQSFETPNSVPVFAGFFAVLGHCHPVWLRFVGGKGVATALGVLLGISGWLSLVAVSIFSVVITLVRITSAASLTACCAVLLTSFMIPMTTVERVVIWLMVSLIMMRHTSNLSRLLKGTEPRL